MHSDANTPNSSHDDARRSRNWIAGVIAFCVLLSAIDTVRFVRRMEKVRPTLKRWLPYAAEIGSDDQLYARHPDYLYPPIFLVLLKPLTWVSPIAAAIIWQLSKYASIVLIFAMAFRIVGQVNIIPTWVKVGSILLSTRFLYSDLSHGNVNIFIALLVITAFYFLARRWTVACGLCIALAACIKVTPALFIVYLAYKRCWRAILGAAVGTIVCLWIAPLTVLSNEQNLSLLSQWRRHVIDDYAASGEVYSQHMNQSLAAVTNRLFGRDDLTGGKGRIVTLIDLPNNAVKQIQRAAALLLLVSLGWFCRGDIRKINADALAVEWSMVSTVTLLLSGYTWTGHFALLALPFVVLLKHLAVPRRDNRGIWAFACAGFTLLCLTGDNLTPAGREWASALGAEMFGTICLLIALAMIRRKLRSHQVD